MIEVTENIFVGNLINYENLRFDEKFCFVQACKEPCHRKALGYTGRAPQKEHPAIDLKGLY